MKNIIDYIIEAASNKIDPNFLSKLKYPNDVLYMIQAYFLDNFTTKYSVNNKQDKNKLWRSFTNYLSKARINPSKYHLLSADSIINFVGEYGQNDKYKSKLSKAIECLQNLFDSSEKKEAGKKFRQEYGDGEKLDKDTNIENPEYTVVCRSKYGNGDVLFWDDIKGNWKNQVNGIKQVYSEETGIGYYEARPILYTNWLKLDDVHKDATCPDGIDTND